jgi:hypothetical protein
VYPNFPDWSPAARTANGKALCHYVQLYRYFVSQSSEFYRHNPLCCFSMSVYCCCCCCCLFCYRLSPKTFGYTLVHMYIRLRSVFMFLSFHMHLNTSVCSRPDPPYWFHCKQVEAEHYCLEVSLADRVLSSRTVCSKSRGNTSLRKFLLTLSSKMKLKKNCIGIKVTDYESFTGSQFLRCVQLDQIFWNAVRIMKIANIWRE